MWQPEGDFFSRNGGGKKSAKSDDDIIDVDFDLCVLDLCVWYNLVAALQIIYLRTTMIIII